MASLCLYNQSEGHWHCSSFRIGAEGAIVSLAEMVPNGVSFLQLLGCWALEGSDNFQHMKG